MSIEASTVKVFMITWRKVGKIAMGDGFVNQYTLDSFIATCRSSSSMAV